MKSIYEYNDFDIFTPELSNKIVQAKSLDDLLEKDKKREEDGFPRKIKVGKLIRPGKGKKDKIVVVPTTQEEKLWHDKIRFRDGSWKIGGTGEEEEGDILGEEPIRQSGAGGGSGPGGDGDSENHDIESSAYELGKTLTEKFELPNLIDKGKKKTLTRYTYDLTDKNRRFGQVLDKKATLKKIVETNLMLNRDIKDTSRMIVSPDDKIYRILSREKYYESQAVVFFLRDYSGSMYGKKTEVVVRQHILIYSWLVYQYKSRVETRFILHDTEGKEVPDFYTYYNSAVAGGTRIASGIRLINEIVEKESLARDYNIYVFQGTDGDDWDTEGKDTIPELKRALTYVNRFGTTIVEPGFISSSNNTTYERNITNNNIKRMNDVFRLDSVSESVGEDRLIKGIKILTSP